nr:hypothetical protein Itr_chr09CG10230 [Ipomoea trifida]
MNSSSTGHGSRRRLREERTAASPGKPSSANAAAVRATPTPPPAVFRQPLHRKPTPPPSLYSVALRTSRLKTMIHRSSIVDSMKGERRENKNAFFFYVNERKTASAISILSSISSYPLLTFPSDLPFQFSPPFLHILSSRFLQICHFNPFLHISSRFLQICHFNHLLHFFISSPHDSFKSAISILSSISSDSLLTFLSDLPFQFSPPFLHILSSRFLQICHFNPFLHISSRFLQICHFNHLLYFFISSPHDSFKSAISILSSISSDSLLTFLSDLPFQSSPPFLHILSSRFLQICHFNPFLQISSRFLQICHFNPLLHFSRSPPHVSFRSAISIHFFISPHVSFRSAISIISSISSYPLLTIPSDLPFQSSPPFLQILSSHFFQICHFNPLLHFFTSSPHISFRSAISIHFFRYPHVSFRSAISILSSISPDPLLMFPSDLPFQSSPPFLQFLSSRFLQICHFNPLLHFFRSSPHVSFRSAISIHFFRSSPHVSFRYAISILSSICSDLTTTPPFPLHLHRYLKPQQPPSIIQPLSSPPPRLHYRSSHPHQRQTDLKPLLTTPTPPQSHRSKAHPHRRQTDLASTHDSSPTKNRSGLYSRPRRHHKASSASTHDPDATTKPQI